MITVFPLFVLWVLTLSRIVSGSGPMAQASYSGPVCNGSLGAQRFVAINGNDRNDGSACRPWATIQHAADVVQPGEVVVVEDGTYVQTVAITRGGKSTAPVVFTARHKWGAKLAPTQMQVTLNSSDVLYISHASYVTVQNFEFIGDEVARGAALKIDSGTHDTLRANNIHGYGTSAASCEGVGSGVLIADNNEAVVANMIWNLTPPRTASFRCNQGHAIYVTAGANGSIQNNMIFQIWQGYALHLNGRNLSRWTISNNTVFNVGDSAHNSGGSEIFWCEGGTCDYNTFTNNIFYDVKGDCWVEYNAGGVLGTYNIYRNNLVSDCGSSSFLTGSLQNTISRDPQFVNYTGDNTGDYHLKSTSPAIRHGTATGAPRTDFEGLRRGSGGAIDIGAYRYVFARTSAPRSRRHLASRGFGDWSGFFDCRLMM